MTLRIGAIVVDCLDLKRATNFWTAALGYEPDSASDKWVSLVDPQKRNVDLGLQPDADPKTHVNRLHLDLYTADVEREVSRLEGLGAKRAEWSWYTQGAKYVVMLDTEGNEFCICPA